MTVIVIQSTDITHPTVDIVLNSKSCRPSTSLCKPKIIIYNNTCLPLSKNHQIINCNTQYIIDSKEISNQ